MEFNAVVDEDILPEKKDDDKEKTILDSLRSELKKEIRNQPVTLSVPSRDGMSVVYDTNIEANNLQAWRKACADKKMPDNFDGLRFSCIILANQAKQILFKGKVATDEDDKELNFRNVKFLEMLDAGRAVDGVRKLYGIDGHIFIAADTILRAAGYDSESQDPTDPTLVS